MTAAFASTRDLWLRSVESFADRIAVESQTPDLRLSYAELHERACTVAELLRTHRPEGAGRLVGLRTGDRLSFCIGLLGLWLADAVPVPLAADAPDAYVQRLARRLGIGAVLTDDAPGVLRLTAQPAVPTAAAESTAGLAYVMHTSGSTGEPKPVALSHAALISYCAEFAAATGLAGSDRFLQLAPVTFDVVFEELLPIWSVGGTAVLAPGLAEDPERLLADIEARAITVAELTTVYWALLVRRLRTSGLAVPPSLRLLLMGGERASAELIAESLRLGLPLAHVYGVTEAAITTTVKHFDPRHPVDTASVGAALPNATVHIVDDSGSPLRAGECGEVWIGGEGLAEGYLGDPVETARRFVVRDGDGPLSGRYYRTGDLGRLTAEGELEILGRLDAQVKVRGARVDPSETESALLKSPLVVEAAVIAVRGPDGAHRLRAFVVPEPEADRNDLAESLHSSLSRSLPPYLVPDRVIALDRLPVTEHGKIDRQALAGVPEGSEARPDTRPVDWANTRWQRIVATAWTSALGRAPSGPDQNFGNAGGDSLALLAVVVNLQEAGASVTALDCLTYPTVRTLASFLENGADAQDRSPESLAPQALQRELRNRHLRGRRDAQRSAR